MINNCKNCFWGIKNQCDYEEDKANRTICEYHRAICSNCNKRSSSYKYQDAYYCFNCMILKFDVYEEEVTEYYKDNKCLGTENDRAKVIRNLDSNIEILD